MSTNLHVGPNIIFGKKQNILNVEQSPQNDIP